jgi:hypothetical protein
MIGGIEAGPYAIFRVLFNHYLVEVAGEADTQQKAKIAEFLEEMANCRDVRVTELLRTEVVPTFLRSQSGLSTYWPLLGHAVRRALVLEAPRLASSIQIPSD